MRKINTNALEELTWQSPRGRFAGAGKQVSEALGRVPSSTDLLKRQPFDIEIARIAPGKSPYPFHSHSMQWEFYHVISGTASVRDEKDVTPVEPGDAFIFEPDRAHQIFNDGLVDLVLYVVTDNPLGEPCHFPDSGKWTVRSPQTTVSRSRAVDYFEGEE